MPPCTTAGCVIDQDVSSDRTKIFCNIKKKVFNQCIAPRVHDETILYNLDVYLELLEHFANDAKAYNGMRVHLASYKKNEKDPVVIPGGKEEQLTLIFVPTLPIAGLTDGGGRDDLDNIQTICDNQLIALPNPKSVPAEQDTATNWIHHYRDNRVPELEKDGKAFTKNAQFRETRSLWYSMASIKGEGKDPGLINFIKCMRDTPDTPGDRIDGVIVRFAGYKENDVVPAWNYQMTLIFDLHQVKDGVISFGTPGTRLRDDPADTGLPCPPDTSCQGSGFPPP